MKQNLNPDWIKNYNNKMLASRYVGTSVNQE